MNQTTVCPSGCRIQVYIEIHQGTGEKIIWTSSNKAALHKCPPRRYWCIQCGAAIREDVPCIHKRIKVGEVQPSELLPKTNYSLF